MWLEAMRMSGVEAESAAVCGVHYSMMESIEMSDCDDDKSVELSSEETSIMETSVSVSESGVAAGSSMLSI